MIFKMKQLTFLNDRTVSEDERRCANAFMNGSTEAEDKERNIIRYEKNQYAMNNSMMFFDLVEGSKQNFAEDIEKK